MWCFNKFFRQCVFLLTLTFVRQCVFLLTLTIGGYLNCFFEFIEVADTGFLLNAKCLYRKTAARVKQDQLPPLILSSSTHVTCLKLLMR